MTNLTRYKKYKEMLKEYGKEGEDFFKEIVFYSIMNDVSLKKSLQLLKDK